MESFTVILKHHASKKWSERYDAQDKDSPVKSLYISTTAFEDGQRRPDKVTMTVTAAE